MWPAETAASRLREILYRSVLFPEGRWKLRFKKIERLSKFEPQFPHEEVDDEFYVYAQGDTATVQTHHFWNSFVNRRLNSYFAPTDQSLTAAFAFYMSEHGFDANGIYIENMTDRDDVQVWQARSGEDDYCVRIDPEGDWSAGLLLWSKGDELEAQTSANIQRDRMYGFHRNKFVLGFECTKSDTERALLFFEISVLYDRHTEYDDESSSESDDDDEDEHYRHFLLGEEAEADEEQREADEAEGKEAEAEEQRDETEEEAEEQRDETEEEAEEQREAVEAEEQGNQLNFEDDTRPHPQANPGDGWRLKKRKLGFAFVRCRRHDHTFKEGWCSKRDGHSHKCNEWHKPR